VKASESDQRKLLDLQELDTRIQRNTRAARSLPQDLVLAELDKTSEALRIELVQADGSLEDARTELSRLESDAATVQARIDRDNALMLGTASVKDAQGIEHELDSLKKRRNDLDEIELTVMEQVEDREANVARVSTARADVTARIDEVRAERQAALDVITQERNNLDRDRNALVATLPADLVALYERQRERYGFGASHLERGMSSASGVRLNESDLVAIRAAAPDDVIMCPDSNAILVRTSESGL
jgi:hypothetical protein